MAILQTEPYPLQTKENCDECLQIRYRQKIPLQVLGMTRSYFSYHTYWEWMDNYQFQKARLQPYNLLELLLDLVALHKEVFHLHLDEDNILLEAYYTY